MGCDRSSTPPAPLSEVDLPAAFAKAFSAAKPEPKFKKSEEITPPRALASPLVGEIGETLTPVESMSDERDQDDAAREALVTSIYIPIQKEVEQKRPPQQITVMLRTTGDRDHDKRRIKTIFGTLISYHGRDRFSFQIFENGSGYLIDFPNDTTRVCPEMLERLKKLIGEESWRVEEITFQ